MFRGSYHVVRVQCIETDAQLPVSSDSAVKIHHKRDENTNLLFIKTFIGSISWRNDFSKSFVLRHRKYYDIFTRIFRKTVHVS